ncbi:MAG: class I SAM-dependent methyltransferase [Micropepsaceae bacterium]
MRIRFLQNLRYTRMEREGAKRRKEREAEGKVSATFPLEASPAWNVIDHRDKFASLKSRWELTKLVRPNGIAAELGVANGVFSDLILKKSSIDYLYSIDMYGDRKHTVDQYRVALAQLVAHRKRNAILKMKFEEALPLFPDKYFDFIYIDGFAATGQDGGSALHDWFPKIKDGGVFAGHDYDGKWPHTKKAVDDFAREHKLKIHTVGGTADPEDEQNRYASWFLVRE